MTTGPYLSADDMDALKREAVARVAPSRGPWMQTYTGIAFYPFDPRPEDVGIEDIAHALANIGRFNGHSRAFYSVAQHSIHVSLLVGTTDAPWGLMHDAAEAYVGDVIRPLKSCMPDYREIERRVLFAVAQRFSLPWPMPPAVVAADEMALATEARDLMAPPPAPWELRALPDRMRDLEPMPPGAAEGLFIDRFHMLTRGTRR